MYCFFIFSCECKLQLESIGDFSVKVIKISVKESDCMFEFAPKCSCSIHVHA